MNSKLYDIISYSIVGSVVLYYSIAYLLYYIGTLRGRSREPCETRPQY